MKKSLQKLMFVVLSSLVGISSFSQNQVYWKEGFEPGSTPACDLTTTNPNPSAGPAATANVSYFFNGVGGSWYGVNVYRTTGSACAGTGINHPRFRSMGTAITFDSGALVTPIVSAGIQEFHFSRARATRPYTIWITNDTSATTTNWTVAAYLKSSASTVTCVDTTVMINSATAKRLKIVARPGTDTDIDSIWLTSVGIITPVKFGAISASQSNNIVKLNWNIETETNTNSYIIERSSTGDVYTQVGTLKANHSANYNFIDNSANNGTNFYRVVALDNNGTKQYSSVVRINIGSTKAGLNVYPNPVKGGQVNVELNGINKGEYRVNVYSITGALVHTTTLTSEGTSLSKAITLPTTVKNGSYTLEITNGSFKSTKMISVQ